MFDRHPRACSAAVFFSATLVLAAIPFAAGAAATQSVSIQTGDLDLASDAGRAALQYRIDHAVDRICGSPHVRTTWEVQNYANCSKAARTAAAAQIDAAVAAAQNARKIATDGNNTAAMR
jgi:UrcA family protein